MKKLFALLLAGAMALSAGAFAATYTHEDDIRFEYDENYFEISMEDHTDDEDLIILTDKNQDSIRIHLRELDDGEKFPTLEELKASEATQDSVVEQMDTWANFKNVLNYGYDIDTYHEDIFIAPVYDDDGEIDAILTVNIGSEPIADEEKAMERSDLISQVVDSLIVDD